MRSVVSVCPAAGSFSLYFLIQLTFGLDLACVSAMAVIRQRSKVKDVGQGKGQYECVCYTRIYQTPVSYEYFDRRPQQQVSMMTLSAARQCGQARSRAIEMPFRVWCFENRRKRYMLPDRQLYSGVTRLLAPVGRSNEVRPPPPIFLFWGAGSLKVKCFAMELEMPKHVGKQNTTYLLRQATGSFIELYHTHFLCLLVINYFGEAVLHPSPAAVAAAVDNCPRQLRQCNFGGFRVH